MADAKQRVQWTSQMEDQLVRLWEERECLFNVSAKSYHVRENKNKSWQEIARAMELSVEEVRGRATSLRTQYSKILRWKPSESGGKELTTKQKWILKSMSFLKAHVVQRPTETSPVTRNTPAEERPCSDEVGWSEDSEQLRRTSSGSSTPPASRTPKPSSTTKKRKKIQSIDVIELEKVKILQQMTSTFQSRSRLAEDADTTFGAQVTSELKLITDPVVKTRVKRRIMTALYEVQERYLSQKTLPEGAR